MIFISYSWVDEKPDQNVLELVAKLRENGYEAECDVMKIQQQTAINFVEMMAKNLQEAEKVIVVLSEQYKKKADSFRGGVGEEYRYIISNIAKERKKYILVSFERNLEKVQPDFLSGRQVVCLGNDNRFNQLLCKLNDVGEYSFPEVNPNKTIPLIQHVSTKVEKNIPPFLSRNRYNLLVSANEDAWDGDSYQLERSRCLTTYTPQNIREEYDSFSSEQIEAIKSYPCIFAYEDNIEKKDAYIGYITDLVVRNNAIKFYIQKNGIITYDNLHKYAFEFDIDLSGSITELKHTHWTIKDVDLGEEIKKRNISIVPYKLDIVDKMFIPSSSMELLNILLAEDNPVDYMQELFANANGKVDNRLRAMMLDLKEKGYLTSKWADNVPYIINFHESAYALKVNKGNSLRDEVFKLFWNKLQNLNDVFIQINRNAKKNPDTIPNGLLTIEDSILSIVQYYDTNRYDLDVLFKEFADFQNAWYQFIATYEMLKYKTLTQQEQLKLGQNLQTVKDNIQILIKIIRDNIN